MAHRKFRLPQYKLSPKLRGDYRSNVSIFYYDLPQSKKKAMAHWLQAQGGVCAICHKGPRDKAYHLDHDHVTGQVRGALCQACNLGLGVFEDDPVRLARAQMYLQESALTDITKKDTDEELTTHEVHTLERLIK